MAERAVERHSYLNGSNSLMAHWLNFVWLLISATFYFLALAGNFTLGATAYFVVDQEDENIVIFLLSATSAKVALFSAGGNCWCWGMFAVFS